MLAEPAAQRRLIDLAELDRKLLQLNHQKATIPELAEIAKQMDIYRKVSEELVQADTALADAQDSLDRVDEDLTPARERLERNQKMVDEGAITDAKSLQSMLGEIEHLKGRISNLEDESLDAMQAVEDATGVRDRLVEGQKAVEVGVRALMKTRDEKGAAIDSQVKAVKAERASLVGSLPTDLVDLYDRIAARTGDVGAGELLNGKCTGCALEMDHASVADFLQQPADKVVRCEECSRILVRP